MYKMNKEKWKSLGQPLEFHNTFLFKKDRGEIRHQGFINLCVSLDGTACVLLYNIISSCMLKLKDVLSISALHFIFEF